MEQASAYVLGEGRYIRTDAEIIRYPERYMDARGVDTWEQIMRILDEIEQRCGDV